MRTGFLLIGTLCLAALNNPTLGILTSPSSSHPSPRFLTITNTSQEETNSQRYPVYPLSNVTAPTGPIQKRAAPKEAAHKLLISFSVAST